MRTVRDILSSKASQSIHSIDPASPTYDALKIMAAKDIGAVAVMENGQLVGLLTEREYARRIVLEGKASRHTPVGETMNRNLHWVELDTNLEACMNAMTHKKMRYLPVRGDDGEFAGLISIGDVVKNVIIDYKFQAEQLQNYVHGNGA